jgi:hypothetical protein
MKLFADIVHNLRSRFSRGSFDILERQRELIHFGIETSAEILDVFAYKDKVGSMRTIRLWVKIRKPDGSFFFTYTHSLAPDKSLPVKGQILRIRYFPDNLSSVVIMFTDKQ